MKKGKRLILLFYALSIVFLLNIRCAAQSVIYRDSIVITNDTSLTKDILFVRANECFAIKFVSANDVIQMIDKEAGKIVGKGYVKVPLPNWGLLKFTFIVECREGRYKYTVQDVFHVYTDNLKTWGGDITIERSPAIPLYMFKSGWDKVRKKGGEAIDILISDFITNMNKSNTENW